MRVLQLTTDLRLAGAERVVIGLARGLRERGVECAVAGLFEGGEERGRARAILEEQGFAVYCAGLEGKWRLWRLAGLRRYVLDWRPDVLHCHMFHGNAAGALLRLSGARGALIWTHHSIARASQRAYSAEAASAAKAGSAASQSSKRRPLPGRRAFDRFFCGLADCQVYVSDAVRRERRRAFGMAGRQELIHDGIDLAPFLSIEPRAGAVFGAIGRLIPGKGFDALIRAFAQVAPAQAAARLRIAGEGPEREALRELARREGVADRVELAGFVDNVPAFLAGISVFVNPSRGEGFGLALLEAMAAGLPCVASRVDSLPEVGGECVRWVRPDDVEELSGAMEEALGAQRSTEQVARQRDRAARFSADAMTERYLALYRSLAQR